MREKDEEDSLPCHPVPQWRKARFKEFKGARVGYEPSESRSE